MIHLRKCHHPNIVVTLCMCNESSKHVSGRDHVRIETDKILRRYATQVRSVVYTVVHIACFGAVGLLTVRPILLVACKVEDVRVSAGELLNACLKLAVLTVIRHNHAEAVLRVINGGGCSDSIDDIFYLLIVGCDDYVNSGDHSTFGFVKTKTRAGAALRDDGCGESPDVVEDLTSCGG